MSAMLEAALDHAARGWPVFPCSPENKRPLVAGESSPGAHDGGLYLATCDAAQIRQWWQRWPRAMIGVPTGRRIGAFVIDLDPRDHDPDAMLHGLEDWLGHGLDMPASRTQSGGLHLFFALPDEGEIGNRAGLFRRIPDAPETIRAHVDVRGDGGYIIVPPSVMAAGTFYEWVNFPETMPVAPQRLLDAIAKRLDVREGSPPVGDDRPVPADGAALPPSRDDAVAEARHRYAMAALDRETRDLARVGEGARGFELNRAAYALGGLVGAGILSERIAAAGLMDACERNGLAAKDGQQKTSDNLRRALRDGAAKPIDVSQIGARAGTSQARRAARLPGGTRTGGGAAPPDDAPPPDAPPPGPSGESQEGPASRKGGKPPHAGTGGAGWGGDDEEDLYCAALPMTDLGNAMRFVRRCGARFLYVGEWGWMAWDGARWNGHDAEAMVQRAVHDTIGAIGDEASALRIWSLAIDGDEEMERRVEAFKAAAATPFVNPVTEIKQPRGGGPVRIVTAADRLQAWCMASQGNAHVSCIARLAQHYLTAAPGDFDADPMAFNVANGTLRFGKIEDGDYVRFHPHRREDRITKISPVAYDPAADAPLYDRFLQRVHPDTDEQGHDAGGADMRRHLAILGGLSLTGIALPKMWFWYGVGRNGKSVLADIWAHVAGEYSQSIPIESFLDSGRSRRGGEASPDIASLPGVRLLRTSEPEKRSKLAEGLIKLMTGGETMRARHLNRDFFEFKPSFKLIMQGNYKPSIEGTDEGIWARMMLVPWRVTIPEKERDPLLTVKLMGEASGILNRLLDGIRDYLDHGLKAPGEVLRATQEYREDSDPIGRFLQECTKPSLQSRAAGGELYRTYEAWAKADGTPRWSPKAFKRGLADHGIRAIKSSGVFYLDIELIATAESFRGQQWGKEDPEDER